MVKIGKSYLRRFEYAISATKRFVSAMKTCRWQNAGNGVLRKQFLENKVLKNRREKSTG